MVKPVEIKAHSGVRNDVSSDRFSPNDLLIGDNVDIDETGSVFRRLGRELISSGDTSSLWSDGTSAFYVQNSGLYQLFPDMSSRLLEANFGRHVAYASANNTVYLSDGIKNRKISNGSVSIWGVEQPKNTFLLTQTHGDLQPGTYGVAITYLKNGVESGAPRGQFIALASVSGLRLDNIPLPSDSSIDEIAVYVTRPNGETFYRAAVVSAKTTTVTITAEVLDALPLRTQFKGPLPAGQIVSLYAGRAYVCSGNTLWYSEPYEYELCDYRYNYIQFDSNLTIFAPVNDGVFVATEAKTTFLRGREPSEFVSDEPHTLGGILGTLVFPRADYVTKDGVQGAVAMWTSTTGVCAGVTGGQLLHFTSGRYALPAAKRGGGLFKIRSGTPQYVTSLFN